MIVVLDTNVVLTARVPKHRHSPIFTAFAAGRFGIALSTSIKLEWEEIISARANVGQWLVFARILEVASERHSNVLHIEPSFHFRLISADPDDDKFADCAIAANADYLVTEDVHFDAMNTAGYKPRVISPVEFIALL